MDLSASVSTNMWYMILKIIWVLIENNTKRACPNINTKIFINFLKTHLIKWTPEWTYIVNKKINHVVNWIVFFRNRHFVTDNFVNLFDYFENLEISEIITKIIYEVSDNSYLNIPFFCSYRVPFLYFQVPPLNGSSHLSIFLF